MYSDFSICQALNPGFRQSETQVLGLENVRVSLVYGKPRLETLLQLCCNEDVLVEARPQLQADGSDLIVLIEAMGFYSRIYGIWWYCQCFWAVRFYHSLV